MSAPPYMKLYIADYLGDTTHLDRGEHGAYLLLLMAMWRAGGKLPRDDRKLAKLTKCSPSEWEEIKPTILEFFTVRGGSITHKRMRDELERYDATVERRKAAGSKGGAKKASENNGEAEAFAKQKNSKSPHNQNQNQNHKKDIGSNEPLSPSGDVAKAVEIWNSVAEACGLPRAEVISEGRTKAIKARLKHNGLEGWAAACKAVERSRTCRGMTEINFRADIDFVAQAKSFGRLLEGFYGADADAPVDPDLPPPVAFKGPPELRAEVVDRTSEDFARSYLDACTWDQGARTLTAKTKFAADQLRAGLGAWTAHRKVRIENPATQASRDVA